MDHRNNEDVNGMPAIFDIPIYEDDETRRRSSDKVSQFWETMEFSLKDVFATNFLDKFAPENLDVEKSLNEQIADTEKHLLIEALKAWEERNEKDEKKRI